MNCQYLSSGRWWSWRPIKTRLWFDNFIVTDHKCTKLDRISCWSSVDRLALSWLLRVGWEMGYFHIGEVTTSFSNGREPWPSGYGRRLRFQRSLVRIPASYTGWTWPFSHWSVVKIVMMFVWKDQKNEEDAGVGPFFKKIDGKDVNLTKAYLKSIFKTTTCIT